MAGTVLLTLGRLPKGLDIARSFASLGWRVVVADAFSSHLMGASRSVARSYLVPPPTENPRAYLESLVKIVSKEAVDLVVPVSEDVLFVAELPMLLEKPVPVFTMPAALVHQLHDKFRFPEWALKSGLTVPETTLGGTQAAHCLMTKGPTVAKPRHSCAGNGIHYYNQGDRDRGTPDEVIQQKIVGRELSTCSIAIQGKLIGTAIYRAQVLSGTVACSFERIDHPEIEHWVARFVELTHWNGFVSFDFIVAENGVPFAIECNPRTTSGLHFFETDEIAPVILGQKLSVSFKKEQNLMQFWSVLQETQDSFGDWSRFFRNLGHLWRTKDVTYSKSDPWPMISMPWTARGIIAEARRSKVPFGIAATRDLAWSGPLAEFTHVKDR